MVLFRTLQIPKNYDFLDKFCDEIDISSGMCVHVGANCSHPHDWESSPSSIFTKKGHKTYYFDLLKKNLALLKKPHFWTNFPVVLKGFPKFSALRADC